MLDRLKAIPMEEPNAICDSKLPGIFPRQGKRFLADVRRDHSEIRPLERERDSDASGTRSDIHESTNIRQIAELFYDSENFGIHFARLLFSGLQKIECERHETFRGRARDQPALIDPERAPEEFDFARDVHNGFKILSPIDPFLKFLPVRRRELVSAMRKKPSAVFPEEGRKQNLRILAGDSGAFERVFHRHRLLS